MAFLDPDNNLTARGKVYSKPRFFTTKEGVEFKCSFILQVMRKYKSKSKEGESFVGFDLIPVDYLGTEKMQWCHANVTQGREISAIGPLESSYRDGRFSIVVNAHTLVNVREFESESISDETKRGVVQKELPFD